MLEKFIYFFFNLGKINLANPFFKSLYKHSRKFLVSVYLSDLPQTIFTISKAGEGSKKGN